MRSLPSATRPRSRMSPKRPSRVVESVAILGAGTRGGGIAMSFANAGIHVTLIEKGREQLKRGMAAVRKNWEATVLAADLGRYTCQTHGSDPSYGGHRKC